MRSLIFKLVSILFFFFFSISYAKNINNEYEIIKNNIDPNNISSSQNFFFASSYSKATAIEDADVETNKMIASAKFIDYLSTLVDWPKKIDVQLKIALWNFYVNKKQIKLKKFQIVDQGKLGEYFYVVVGIPKEELLKITIKYSQIINSIR